MLLFQIWCHFMSFKYPLLPIIGFVLDENSSETLQNLPYFIYTKTQICFIRFFIHATLYFYLMNALVYVNTQHMANFEALPWNFSSSTNSEIGRSVVEMWILSRKTKCWMDWQAKWNVLQFSVWKNKSFLCAAKNVCYHLYWHLTP